MTQKIINRFPKEELLKNIEAYQKIIKIGKITQNLAEILKWRIEGYKLGENWNIEWIKEQIRKGIKVPTSGYNASYGSLDAGGSINNAKEERYIKNIFHDHFKVLYLHGLDATPESDHVKILEHKDITIIAPKLDYRKKPLFDYLAEIISKYNISGIVGHSIGGYLAYHLSNKFHKAALMFNPAFGSDDLYLQPIPEFIKNREPYNNQMAVVGLQDEEVPAKDQLRILEDGNARIYALNINHDVPDNVKIKYFDKWIETIPHTDEETDVITTRHPPRPIGLDKVNIKEVLSRLDGINDISTMMYGPNKLGNIKECELLDKYPNLKDKGFNSHGTPQNVIINGEIRYVPISKLVSYKDKLIKVDKDIKEGKLSHSKDIPAKATFIVHMKKWLIQDGNHRSLQHALDGKWIVPISIDELNPKMYSFQTEDSKLISIADFCNISKRSFYKSKGILPPSDKFKERIEKESGLKVSMVPEVIDGSLTGYIIFEPIKMEGSISNFDDEYVMNLHYEFPGEKAHCNFFRGKKFSVYYGNSKKIEGASRIEDTDKKEIGGKINPREAIAKKMAEDYISKLSKEDLKSIKDKFNEIVSNVLIDEEKKLNELSSKKELLEKESNELYEKEKGLPYGEEKDKLGEDRRKIRRKIMSLDLEIRSQKNIVKAIADGGELVEFTDKKGMDHKRLPYFVRIKTDIISFDEETILTDAIPPYMPFIDEEKFARNGYVFDAIRIAPDQYILAVNGYNELKGGKSEYRIEQPTEAYHPSDAEQGYVMVSLDQLVLINDYYFTKAKAIEIKKADEQSVRNEAYYDSLSVERRSSHLNQKGFYHALPNAVRKKITQPEYEALSLEEKEKLYKPFKKGSVKRLVSRLTSDKMWASFHEMYERFMNPAAVPINKDGSPIRPGQNRGSIFGTFGNPETFEYWHDFSDMMKWKMLDIQVQREVDSEIRKIALETSFGESNTNDVLKEEYGILVKRQNGTNILPNEIDQIKEAWKRIQVTFGNLSHNARKDNLKISHTGIRFVFASKAAGTFIPDMKTIAVSGKFGDNQFADTMAHEVAHWMDYGIGHLKGKRYASDDFESTSGIIARTFRKLMNKKSDSNYTNATKECFARAMEEYFAFENFGEEATLISSVNKVDTIREYHSEEDYVSKENFSKEIKPLIKQFLSEQESFFKYNVDSDQPTITMAEGGIVRSIPISKLVSFDWKLKEVQKDIEEGRLSYSKDKPTLVTYLPHLRKYLIQDGNHRTLERIMDGEKIIPVIINEHQPKMYAFQIDDKQLVSLADLKKELVSLQK